MVAGLAGLLDAGVRAVADAVNGGEVDPVELAGAAVERAAAAPENALVVLDGDRAREHAEELARRLARGERPALAGVPVAHKDLLDTAAFPTTYGNPRFAARPGRDATAVARTVAAGAIQIGKTNLDELGYGVTGRNPHLADVAHPSVPGHVVGGSSGGAAAAVATGSILASLGTDTGGSVRIPASCCGVVGCKVTRGLVPTTGALPLSWQQDTVGPIAARAEDAALVLSVVVGPDGEDPVARTAPPGWSAWPLPAPRDVAVLVAPQLWDVRVDPRVAQVCRSRLAEVGTVREVELPRFGEARRAQAAILAANALAVHGERLARDPDAFGAAVRERLERARSLSGADVAGALRVRDEWVADLEAVLGPAAVLASPTIAVPPPRADAEVVVWPDGEEEVTPALTRLTGVFNLAMLPAVSVPAGTVDGLPVGLQLVGAPWTEPLLLALASALRA